MLRTKPFLPQRRDVARDGDKAALLFGAFVVMATLLPAIQCTCDREACTKECQKTGWEYGECCIPGGAGVPEVCKCFRHSKSSTTTKL